MTTRDYDSTVARIAGNLLSGVPQLWMDHSGHALLTADAAIRTAVHVARAIVIETRRQENP